MKDFAAFETKYERTPVRLIDYESATGVLFLKGMDTLLHSTSPSAFHPGPIDENGWFWLRLEAPDGQVILLHHALTLGESNHRWGDERPDTFSSEIYPNLVVDDIRGLTNDHLVSRVMFRLRGLHYFFYYRHTEPLLSFDGTEEQVAALRAMQLKGLGDEDLFAPNRVYVTHDLPTYLSFGVADRTYEVWTGAKEKFGSLHKIDVEAFPIASIAFDQPVDLDTAIERMYEWRTFFSQIAMVPLQVESVSVQASLELRGPIADLYIAGASRYPDLSKSHYALHPAYLPLNSWKDRSAMSDCMQRWLQLQDKRDTFRRKLYRVIESMNLRVEARDLIELASAVESLEELAEGEPIQREALDSMSRAAHEASIAAKLEIDENRIRGVLGNLQRPSLAQRYARMGERVTPRLSAADAEMLARSATRIRHASAHGGALDQEMQPRIAPTVQALAALCARFDLETNGVPIRSGSDSRVLTKRRFDDAIDTLKQIEAETEAPSGTSRPKRLKRRSSRPEV